MIRKIWAFVSEPKNLAVIALLGSGLAFAWKAVEPRLFDKIKPASEQPSHTQTAIAKGAGAQAFNADGSAQIGTGSAAAQQDNSERAGPLTQKAESGPGAQAINAADKARVNVVSQHN